jgi:hypothetical protein
MRVRCEHWLKPKSVAASAIEFGPDRSHHPLDAGPRVVLHDRRDVHQQPRLLRRGLHAELVPPEPHLARADRSYPAHAPHAATAVSRE